MPTLSKQHRRDKVPAQRTPFKSDARHMQDGQNEHQVRGHFVDLLGGMAQGVVPLFGRLARTNQGRPVTGRNCGLFAREQSGIITSVSDRAATGGALDVVLATPEQLRRIAELDESGEAIEEIRVPSPYRTGIAIIKVLVDRPSGRANAENVLRAVQCGSEALPG